jgi:predicted HicB family RNase H-like nuclease
MSGVGMAPPRGDYVLPLNSDDQRFTLRIDDELRHELMACAQRQMRSLNREIQFRLRKSLEAEPESMR